MRVVCVGAGSLTLRTARALVERGHEVVIIEHDKGRIAELPEDLDCGVLHGDGTRPALLREADPGSTDVLLCLTGNDQANIIASLVGRSLDFPRVVTRIQDEEFEHICIELGLENTVIPARTIGRYLADLVEGHDVLELSAVIRGDARTFVFVARQEDEGRIEDLGLPKPARITHLYREGRLLFGDADAKLQRGDEVVVITDRKHLDALRERWGGPGSGAPGSGR